MDSNPASVPLADLFDLTGTIAIVTGGCGLLGRVFASALATYGAGVGVLDLPEAEPPRVADALADECGGRVLGLPCDVARPESVDDAIDRVEADLGGIDVLVNNAATKSRDVQKFFKPVEDFPLETWREVMAVNIDGMFIVARAAGRRMIARGRGGSIIQVSSIYGALAPDPSIYEGSSFLGGPINTPPVYAASKAGVAGLSRYLAAYWAPHGIRVNTISPGGVASGQNETFLARYGRRVPLGRMAEASEMAGAAVFLASRASSYVTGQNLLIDGGLSVW
jgi:NAD(P)-dependent dehydrogenase (short-subunit alcohol dehydrogenase family)